jgi:hypothetical protein
MKIVNHKYHSGHYLLYTDDNKFTGAGISGWLDTTRVVWYSGTADIPDQDATKMIADWAKQLNGTSDLYSLGTSNSGMCTRSQSWNEWTVNCRFKNLLEIMLDETVKY